MRQHSDSVVQQYRYGNHTSFSIPPYENFYSQPVQWGRGSALAVPSPVVKIAGQPVVKMGSEPKNARLQHIPLLNFGSFLFLSSLLVLSSFAGISAFWVSQHLCHISSCTASNQSSYVRQLAPLCAPPPHSGHVWQRRTYFNRRADVFKWFPALTMAELMNEQLANPQKSIFDLDSGADDTFRDAAAPPPTSTQPQVSAAL